LRTTGAAGDRAFLRRVVVETTVADERLALRARRCARGSGSARVFCGVRFLHWSARPMHAIG